MLTGSDVTVVNHSGRKWSQRSCRKVGGPRNERWHSITGTCREQMNRALVLMLKAHGGNVIVRAVAYRQDSGEVLVQLLWWTRRLIVIWRRESNVKEFCLWKILRRHPHRHPLPHFSLYGSHGVNSQWSKLVPTPSQYRYQWFGAVGSQIASAQNPVFQPPHACEIRS